MRYAADDSIDAVYKHLARLAAPLDPNDARLDESMVVADALLSLGQDRSWASVWWAYGALHHDLSDEALSRALDLLRCVDHPDEARAAALMLQAEVKGKQAAYGSMDSPPGEQRLLLEEAVKLAPTWPSLRLRLARACTADREEVASREHATQALALLPAKQPTDDPFDTAITGRNLDRDYVEREVAILRQPGT